MTALAGLPQFITDRTFDWTQMQQRPAKLQAAYENMLSAWADYMAADNAPVLFLNSARDIAAAADAEYRRLYRVWQASMEPCACRPGRPNEGDYTCASCRAKAELEDSGEMPY